MRCPAVNVFGSQFQAFFDVLRFACYDERGGGVEYHQVAARSRFAMQDGLYNIGVFLRRATADGAQTGGGNSVVGGSII